MKTKRKPKNYWNKEKCTKEALKYNKKSDFKFNSGGAYNFCKKNGWLDELSIHMKAFGNRFSRLVYIYEFSDKSVYVGLTYNINERDSKHKRDKRSKVYQHIKLTNINPLLTYSKFMSTEDAKKQEQETIEAFRNKGYLILNVAQAGGAGSGYLKWTLEKCKAEALKYKTRKEFYKNNNSAYNSARSHGWMEIVCVHMPKNKKNNKGYWTKLMCKNEVKKYDSRNEIYKKRPGAYMAMFRNGWLDELCSHLKTKKKNGYWSKEMCMKEALKYSSKKEFCENSGAAYRTMLYNNWTEQICLHMKNK